MLEAGMRVFHRFLLPGGELLWHLPLPATRGFNSARDDFDRMMLALIRSRNGAAQDPPDLIDHLIILGGTTAVAVGCLNRDPGRGGDAASGGP